MVVQAPKIWLIIQNQSKKIFHAQEEIRSQIVKKEMSPFEAVKERLNNLEKLCHVLRANKATSAEPECFFQQQDYLSQNTETVWMMTVWFDFH